MSFAFKTYLALLTGSHDTNILLLSLVNLLLIILTKVSQPAVRANKKAL